MLQPKQAKMAAAAAGALYLAWPLVRRLSRALVETVDPLCPSAADADAILARPLRVEDVEKEIEETKATTEGAARAVKWADVHGPPRKTALAVVYLHGWSACRQEIAPTPQLLARALGANLYCHRLSGHGRRKASAPRDSRPDGSLLLREATPGRLFRDALEALRVGRAIGDRVVLLGVSTGGALAAWLAAREKSARDAAEDERGLAAVVLVSPCFGLGHPLYPVLKIPFAAMRLVPFSRPLRAGLISLLLGPTKKGEPYNADHNRFHCLVYPQPAVLHLLDVLFSLERLDFRGVRAPTMIIANAGDPVVDFGRAADKFRELGTSRPDALVPKAFFACPSDEHPHVLASQMLSPATVDAVADAAILFVRQHTGARSGLRRKQAPGSKSSFGSLASLAEPMFPF